MWPFNTGDCLIEVTAWAGLIVCAQTDFAMQFSVWNKHLNITAGLLFQIVHWKKEKRKLSEKFRFDTLIKDSCKHDDHDFYNKSIWKIQNHVYGSQIQQQQKFDIYVVIVYLVSISHTYQHSMNAQICCLQHTLLY